VRLVRLPWHNCMRSNPRESTRWFAHRQCEEGVGGKRGPEAGGPGAARGMVGVDLVDSFCTLPSSVTSQSKRTYLVEGTP